MHARLLSAANEDGFTLLEMLIVLVILSMTFSVASARFVNRPDHVSPAQFIEGLATSLAAERNLALSIGEIKDVIINLENRKIAGATFTIPIPDQLNVKLTIGRELLTEDKKGIVRFFPDGSSVGAEIKASVPGSTLSSLAKVNWLTGIITTEEQVN